jgi:hypothetical protein
LLGIVVNNFILVTEYKLTTDDGPAGVGAIAIKSTETSFADTRKVVLSLTSTLRNITVHLKPHPINPRFLRIYRFPKPTLEQGGVLPIKPVQHTYAAINRPNLAVRPSRRRHYLGHHGAPFSEMSRPTRHHHITERHEIISVSVTMNAHGSSFIGG